MLRSASIHEGATRGFTCRATAPLNLHIPQGILEDPIGEATLSPKSQPAADVYPPPFQSLGWQGLENFQVGDLEGGGRQNNSPQEVRKTSYSSAHIHHDTPPHHHHVPNNGFLSIGLQTSIAIALHKLPEGFITYATNHANPQLGFAVFMALFIHNITEGFAMALPLFLALQSRWKAMFWSSLLGGFSQPAGAGVAALWFKLAGQGSMKPGEAVYGIMFAITAGIMTSVALQLFSEAMSISRNRPLCITFAFIGMGILGVSFALTAG
ncbi:MAG: hypothetical protein M1813_005131 [Trichoglossum hirsutum]|nr:MAG: hypothetical protein M1813_005131 [Trichoglossum hirsutum]